MAVHLAKVHHADFAGAFTGLFSDLWAFELVDPDLMAKAISLAEVIALHLWLTLVDLTGCNSVGDGIRTLLRAVDLLVEMRKFSLGPSEQIGIKPVNHCLIGKEGMGPGAGMNLHIGHRDSSTSYLENLIVRPIRIALLQDVSNPVMMSCIKRMLGLKRCGHIATETGHDLLLLLSIFPDLDLFDGEVQSALSASMPSR